MLEQIKKEGCAIGLSGGLDSSRTLHWAIENGLKPLCFTFDNGYNTPEADHNIKAMVKGLDHKIIKVRPNRYKKLQEAFIKAGLPNVEIPTDHILMAISLKFAKENGVKWILSGGNTVSESIMPESWSYPARDLTHIKDVYKKMTGENLDKLPLCSVWMWNDYKWNHGIETIYPLDYIDYNLEESRELLKEKYGWKDYGNKHEENIFTQWFQNFYLQKFGIDKRKAHLSSLINAGQMTKEEALQKITDS